MDDIVWDDEKSSDIVWDDEKPKSPSALPQATSNSKLDALKRGDVRGVIMNPFVDSNTVGKAGRVLVNAAASPAVLASKLYEKSTKGTRFEVPMADLDSELNAGMDKLGIAKLDPNALNETLTMDMAKSAPAFAVPGGIGAQMSTGALLGNIQAPAGEEGLGTFVGAATPAAFKGVGHAGSSLIRTGQNLFSKSAGRAVDEVQKIFGDRTDAAIQALRSLKPSFAGEQVTAGDAASVVLPELKALQEGARSRHGGHRFLTIEDANKTEGQRILDEMGYRGKRFVDSAEGVTNPSEAEAMRTQITKPLYKMAEEDRIQLTPELQKIVEGAEVQPAVARGEKSFSQAQTNADVGGGNVPVGEMAGQSGVPRDPLMRGYAERTGTFMPDNGSRSINDLQRIKGELDKQIEALSTSTDGASKLKASQLMMARNQLTAEMRKGSGAYGVAQDAFRNASAPQNQADIANVLAGEFGKGSKQFLGATNDAAKTLKRADQSSRFQNIEEVMTPEQMATIRQLKNSAKRQVGYENLEASQGMIPDYLSPIDQALQLTPGYVNSTMTAIRGALRAAVGQSDRATQKVIDTAMTSPDKMIALLKQTPPDQRNAVINLLRKGGADPRTVAAVTAGAIPNEGEQ